MNYRLKHSKQAFKDLKKYKKKNKQDYNKLKEDIRKILLDPYKTENISIGGSKCPRCKRMKSGKYRIIYYIHTKEQLIEIVRVIERKKNYREF